MRALLVTTLVLFPAVAHAESFLEILGGLSIPVGDSAWTNTAESSPQLGVHVGAVNETGLGALLQVDWTPVNLDQPGGSSPFSNLNIARHRFRILANIAIQKPVGPPKLSASFRAGIGIDIQHASASGNVLGANFSSSDTDTGFAFELAGGLWYDLGSAQIGGEVALPIGHHGKQGNNTDGNYSFDFTTYDLDFLLGIRLISH